MMGTLRQSLLLILLTYGQDSVVCMVPVGYAVIPPSIWLEVWLFPFEVRRL